jgi:predicted RNA methylase
MDKMSEFWSMNEGTFYCLYDRKRTIPFKKAIFNTVKKGDTIVELGAGSGVLSMFAVDAGAEKVYAVELDEANISSLRSTIKANGYEDKIVIIHDDATTVNLPEKVDVVICELIATGLVEELQIPAMNHIQKYLKKDARILLSEYHVTLDLVEQKNIFYNKRFDVIRYEFPDKKDLTSSSLTKEAVVKKVDFRSKIKNSFIKETIDFQIAKSGLMNGIRLGGNTIFADGSSFGFSLSYSFPAILPIETVKVSKGDRFRVNISYSMCEGPKRLKYDIKKISHN